MKVAVVILNWNGLDFLRRFLPSVVRHSGDATIIVADNASTDDSCSMLNREFPSVRQISNKENFGFAGGYNEALKQVDAEYFILLNSDVEVTPGWITPVIEMMDADKSIAACQPKILSYADRDAFEYAGAAGGFIDKFGYPFCRGRIFDTVEKDTGQYNDARLVFWATGACMFIRAQSFREAGGFDAAFFAHMEEIDLCWRLQHRGGKIYYCPGSTVFHVGGGTLHKSNPHKTYLNFRNNLLMLYKNLPKKDFDRIFRFRKFFDFLAAARFLLRRGGVAEMKAVHRAHRDFRRIKTNPQSGPGREGIKGRGMEQVVYSKSILRAYYLGGKKYFSQLEF